MEQTQQKSPAAPVKKAELPANAGTFNPANGITEEKVYKKWWFWVIVGVVIIGLALLFFL